MNNAIAAVGRLHENRGKLGVFWHTQGSGKSYSMVFFSQKVLRKIPGNWTFVIVTDREDLDGQIYRNFANTGALLEDEKRVRAESAVGLRRMLNEEDHRYVSTLIQKFRTEHGERYPVLSTRSDIIVITDEAHRSQYDIFAANMRSALPNAAFIGFTGTPLMAGEERKPMKNHTLMQTIARLSTRSRLAIIANIDRSEWHVHPNPNPPPSCGYSNGRTVEVSEWIVVSALLHLYHSRSSSFAGLPSPCSSSIAFLSFWAPSRNTPTCSPVLRPELI